MGAYLLDIGFLVFLFGLVNVIYPIRRLRITSRWHGAAILVVSLVLLGIGDAKYTPPPKLPSVARSTGSPGPTPTASPVVPAPSAVQPATVDTKPQPSAPSAGSNMNAVTSPNPAQKSTPDHAAPQDSHPVQYTVASTDDVSFSVVRRYEVRIVVPVGSTEAAIRTAAEQAVTTVTDLEAVNAVSVLVYDRLQDARRTYTLASADWAPNGKLADADKVKAGDYSKNSLSITYNQKVLKPGSIQRPSELEFTLADEFNALQDANAVMSGDEAAGRVAKLHGVTVDQVKVAAVTCLQWDIY